MLRLLLVTVFSVMCLGTPALTTAADSFNPDQPFQQALSIDLLRSLLSQALDRLEDHVESSSSLSQSDPKADQSRSLRFKFYPEGKSKSDRHLSAEGWFRSGPDSGQLDWHFRFKLPDDQATRPLQQIDTPL
jgi:hypothetical protein